MTYASGNHITFLSKRKGVAIVFSGKTGRFERMVALYPSLLEPKWAKADKEPVFLLAQPLPDGDLFIAARTEDAVLAARSAFYKGMDEAFPENTKARAEVMDSASRAMLRSYGDIHYCRFDPAKGSFREALRPDGLPHSLASPEHVQSFAFYVNLDGDIVPRSPISPQKPVRKADPLPRGGPGSSKGP